MDGSAPTYIIGDVHGQLEKLVALLQGAGLISGNRAWAGANAALWFLGDYVDRGPDGIGVIELVMRLQQQAATVAGHVGALLGNHDILLLAAQRFGARPSDGPGGTFRDDWRHNGGNPADLARMTPAQARWIANLPVMAHVGDHLLIHADSAFYRLYGRSIANVNRKVARILQGEDVNAWCRLLTDFGHRGEFDERAAGGAEAATQMLLTFGGRQIIHGHTPIAVRDRRAPITAPLIYQDGLCVNVDGGMFSGEPGFIYKLPSEK